MQKPGVKRLCGRTKFSVAGPWRGGWRKCCKMRQSADGDQTVFGLACVLSHIQLFATPWTVACQAPLSMEISQARILEWVAIPTPGDLPDPGSNPHLFCLLHWLADSLPLSHLASPTYSLEEPLKSLYSVLRMHHSAASLTCNRYISSHCPKWAVFTSLVICTVTVSVMFERGLE